MILRRVRKNYSKRLLDLSCLYVRQSFCMQHLGSYWGDFQEILYLRIFRKICRETLKFHENRTRIMSTLQEDQYTFLVIFRLAFLRMRNVSHKRCRGNKNTDFMFNNFFFQKLRRVWDKVEKYCRGGQATAKIWGKRVACWVPNATNTHSEYVILIDFPLQQRLHERASKLRYTYIACLVIK